MRIYNIFGRSAHTHYRNRATASTACPQMPHVAQYTFLFRTNTTAVLLSLPYVQSSLAANGSTLPNDRHKDRTFSPSGSTFSPPSWRCTPRLRDFLSKTPQLFQKNGEKSPKSPPFSISSLPPHVRNSQEK